MMDARRPRWVWGLFLEYFIAGVATAAGEAIITESIKAVKRRRKRARKQDPERET